MSTGTACSILRKTLPNELELEGHELYLTEFKLSQEGSYVKMIRVKKNTDPDWSEWRSELIAIGGSDFASICGHGYESPRKTLARCLGYEKKKTHGSFSNICMEHGRKYESTVIDMLNHNRGSVLYRRLNETFIFRSHIEDKPDVRFSVTPDCITFDEMVAEIKCPYVGSHNTYSTAQEFSETWHNAHPIGKESYFLQALFYHWFLRSNLLFGRKHVSFKVVVGFINNDTTATCISFTYYYNESLYAFIVKALNKIIDHASRETINSYRVTKAEREEITKLMKESFFGYSQRDEFELDVSGKPLYVIEEEQLLS